ncbi:MAG: hypothetical protein ACOC8E_02340 [Planctomycetota bacterium]
MSAGAPPAEAECSRRPYSAGIFSAIFFSAAAAACWSGGSPASRTSARAGAASRAAGPIQRKARTDRAALREGAYLLRTNLNDRTPEDLWRTYIQVTDAEAAFRTIKTDLVVRPIYHQTERRAHAHILVAFLAYAMWKTLQKWMEEAGRRGSPRKWLPVASLGSGHRLLACPT